MNELSGTLEGVGLPAIVRFLTGLKKTGYLRIVQDEWRGEIFFDTGQVVSANLGSRTGLAALDALVHALPSGSFTFEVAAHPAGAPNITLSSDALLAHLDDLGARAASGVPRLPSLEAVPVVVNQDESDNDAEPLPLDRSTLQTLLAIDGQRTVREVVARRGSLDTLWQLASLAAVGLVRIQPSSAPRSEDKDVAGGGAGRPADVPSSIAAHPVPTVDAVRTADSTDGLRAADAAGGARLAETPGPRPLTLHAELHPRDPEPFVHACPRLGFEDDPANSFGRPTRLHRCFAAGAPLPLSLDQQRELCLSDEYATCPRLAMLSPGTQRDAQARPAAASTGPRAGSARSTSDADDPRIVRLPFVARATAADRGVIADRQAVGGAEPTRFRGPAAPAREGIGARPTPLRARIDRAAGGQGAGALPDPMPAAVEEPRKPEATARSMRAALLDESTERRLGGIPVPVIFGTVMVIAVLAMVGYLIAPQLSGVLSDESIDTSALPNSAAIAAGTPIANIAAPRTTPVANPAGAAGTNAASGANSAPTSSAGAASAASVAGAPAQPTLLPEANQPAARATSVSQSAPAAPAQAPSAAAPAAPAQAAAVAQPDSAPGTIFDERFLDNAHAWPSNPQGTAYLTAGSYRLSPRQAGQFVAVGAPIVDLLQDVVVTASFHKLSGPAGGGYGIIVRDQGPAPRDGNNQTGRYYVLEAGDKGEVGIWRREADHWVDLLPWQRADAVKTGNGTNELTARVIGTRLSLSVNGTEVATRTDATFASGGVGLFVGGDGNQVAVDHFAITQP